MPFQVCEGSACQPTSGPFPQASLSKALASGVKSDRPCPGRHGAPCVDTANRVFANDPDTPHAACSLWRPVLISGSWILAAYWVYARHRSILPATMLELLSARQRGHTPHRWRLVVVGRSQSHSRPALAPTTPIHVATGLLPRQCGGASLRITAVRTQPVTASGRVSELSRLGAVPLEALNGRTSLLLRISICNTLSESYNQKT